MEEGRSRAGVDDVHASVRKDTSKASVTAHVSVEEAVVADGVDAAHASVEEGRTQAKASDTAHASVKESKSGEENLRRT